MSVWRVLKFLLILAVLAGLAFAAYRYLPKAGEGPGLPVTTVTRRNLVKKVTIAGVVIPKRSAIITAPYNGYIKRLYVKVGDQIKTGEPVVSISQTVGTTAEEVFPLRSPLDGKVMQVVLDEGEYVSSQGSGGQSGSIVRIDDLSRFYVAVSVPEIDISKLKVGLRAFVRLPALSSASYEAKIIEIAQAATVQDNFEKSKVEFHLKAELLDADEAVKPGMSAILDIITDQATGVLAVPQEFVQRRDERYFVTTPAGESKPIEVGLQTEEAFEVVSGVTEGEAVRMTDFLETAGGAGS